MKWFGLSPDDQYYNNWILFREDDDDGIVMRDRYRNDACVMCGKLDEYAAVRSGIDDDVVIRAKIDSHDFVCVSTRAQELDDNTDFVGTSDDFICFSTRAQELVRAEGILGLGFVPLPDQRYSIAIPTMSVEVNLDLAGMRFFEVDPKKCGRIDNNQQEGIARMRKRVTAIVVPQDR